MIYLLPNQIQKIDVYVESKLLLMVLVEVHTPRAQSLHSRLGNRGSDSVAGSPQPETDCVTAANAKVQEEPECSCSETKHWGGFIHESDKEKAWLKNMQQTLTGQYQIHNHFSLEKDRGTKLSRCWFLHSFLI